MKNKIIAIALFLSAIAYSQKTPSFKVLDSKYKEPIDYVYLLDSNNKIITTTDLLGSFDISLIKSDSIKFVKYGYYEKYIAKSSINKDIILESKTTVLDEVIVKNSPIFYKFYFRSIGFKNNVKRRYVDGIIQIEINKRKKRVNYDILEYRIFTNKQMLKKEDKGSIQVKYEPPIIPSITLMSNLETIKKYNDLKLVKNKNGYDILKNNENIGSIHTESYNEKEVEKKSIIVFNNELGKTHKKLGLSGKTLFQSSETHYNPNDSYNSVSYKKTIDKSLFKRKREKIFNTYETHSEIFLIDYLKEPFQEQVVKLKNSKSNYKSEFWKTNNSILKIIDETLYENLELLEN